MNKKMDFFEKKNKKEDLLDRPLYKFGYNILIKSLIVIILFLGALIYVKQSDQNNEKFKKIVYQNSLSFAKIYNVYKKYLGDVIPFKNIYKDNKLVSSEKITYDDIKKEDNGYILSVSNEYTVPIIKSGIVIEVKKNSTYKNLVKIQDKNGLNITYGNLDIANVKLYDYVKKGELLGKCSKELYLIFEKDDKYLSYEEYL